MSRDLRRYARQTNARLFIGFLLLLFIVGDGLIFWLWGRNAAVMGLLCITLGLVPLLLVWVVLTVLEWVVKKADGE